MITTLPRFRNDLERSIADAEVNTNAWTLMHRYHKAADIINEVWAEGVHVQACMLTRILPTSIAKLWCNYRGVHQWQIEQVDSKHMRLSVLVPNILHAV